MGFAVSNGDVAVASLPDVPYDLFHHHQVTEVRVAGWHEPGQDMKLAPVVYCFSDHLVITVTENDPPANKIRDFGKLTDCIPNR